MADRDDSPNPVRFTMAGGHPYPINGENLCPVCCRGVSTCSEPGSPECKAAETATLDDVLRFLGHDPPRGLTSDEFYGQARSVTVDEHPDLTPERWVELVDELGPLVAASRVPCVAVRPDQDTIADFLALDAEAERRRLAAIERFMAKPPSHRAAATLGAAASKPGPSPAGRAGASPPTAR